MLKNVYKENVISCISYKIRNKMHKNVKNYNHEDKKKDYKELNFSLGGKSCEEKNDFYGTCTHIGRFRTACDICKCR